MLIALGFANFFLSILMEKKSHMSNESEGRVPRQTVHAKTVHYSCTIQTIRQKINVDLLGQRAQEVSPYELP